MMVIPVSGYVGESPQAYICVPVRKTPKSCKDGSMPNVKIETAIRDTAVGKLLLTERSSDELYQMVEYLLAENTPEVMALNYLLMIDESGRQRVAREMKCPIITEKT
jgi:hypothetical protein